MRWMIFLVVLAACQKQAAPPADAAPVVLVVVDAAPAAKVDKPVEKADGPGEKKPPELTGVFPDAAPPTAAPVDREGELAACPSTVKGARTVIEASKVSFDVVITGDAVDEIRRRAQKLVEAKHLPASASREGYCPVILDDTIVTYAEAKDGARMTIKPQRKEDLAALLGEARRRAASLPD